MSKQDYIKKTEKLIKKVGGRSVIDEVEKKKIWGDKKFEDPITEDEHLLMSVKVEVDRYATFPDRLPTHDVLPHPPDEHARMGEYETKRDLYLTIAHAYNTAMERIEILEQEVKDLKIK